MSLDEFVRCGNCEPLKAGVHATAFGLFSIMAAYNIAAWLIRRDRHLAINAIAYSALTAWEQRHVAHHMAELRPRARAPQPVEIEPACPRLAA